jgi:hypothetical protein
MSDSVSDVKIRGGKWLNVVNVHMIDGEGLPRGNMERATDSVDLKESINLEKFY